MYGSEKLTNRWNMEPNRGRGQKTHSEDTGAVREPGACKKYKRGIHVLSNLHGRVAILVGIRFILLH